MGNTYEFKCPDCDFQTSCSRGVDRGFTIQVQPMYCSNCKVVKNIHIGNYVRNLEGNIHLESIARVCKTCETGKYLQEWDCHTCMSCGKVGILFRDSGICWD